MKYRLILADPPWRYANRGVNGAAENALATLSTTMAPVQIKALPVKALTARDAVLVLWATWPMLEVALRVIPAWGFRYKTGFPWIKLVGDPEEVRPSWGPGWWARGCSEAVLIGVRGRARPPEGDWLGLLSKRLKHSKKPEDVYAYCESFPGPYLELFAREKRPGWDVWGNEVVGIDLEEAADGQEEKEGIGEWVHPSTGRDLVYVVREVKGEEWRKNQPTAP
jgi:N6-adenosine-specific RNA methylase IME4